MIKAIDITRALAINGFMSEEELVWLAVEASKHKCIVEIGSYLGRSTRALLDHTDGIVYALDDWKGPRDVYIEKIERMSLFPKFCENVREYKDNGKVITYYGEFEDSFNKLKDLQPDMVFIDGSHEYEDIKRDILVWKDRVISGGLLCGHDVNWDSVRRAVEETLGEVELTDSTCIWWTIV